MSEPKRVTPKHVQPEPDVYVGPPRVWVKDVAGQCIVETRNDWANDVQAALEAVGLHVNVSVPIDFRSNVHQFVVSIDGDRLTAQNARALLRNNGDVVVMDE